MSRDHETLKRRLEAYHEDARPPADLLARLQADIPRELPVPGNAESTAPAAPWRGQWWKLAAAVVLLVGAGFLTARLLPDLEPPAAERAAPAAEPGETEAKAAAGERAADEVMQEARQEDLEGAASTAAEPAPVPAPPARPPQAMLREAAPPAAKKRIEVRRQAEADAAFDVPEAPAPRPTRERLAAPPPPPPQAEPEPEPEEFREEIQVSGEAPEARWELLEARAEELLAGRAEPEPGELVRLLRELESLLAEHWPQDADKADLVARITRATEGEPE